MLPVTRKKGTDESIKFTGKLPWANAIPVLVCCYLLSKIHTCISPFVTLLKHAGLPKGEKSWKISDPFHSFGKDTWNTWSLLGSTVNSQVEAILHTAIYLSDWFFRAYSAIFHLNGGIEQYVWKKAFWFQVEPMTILTYFQSQYW